MSHPDETTLDRYRTGELDAADRAELEAHLEACAACREALAGLEAFADRVAEAYAAAEGAAPVPDWDARRDSVLARIEERDAARPGPSEGEARVIPGPWARIRRWAPQAAAAAIAILLVGVLWNEGVREPEDAVRAVRSPEAEQVERAAEPAPRATAPAEPELESLADEGATDGGGETPAARVVPDDAVERKAAEAAPPADAAPPVREAAPQEADGAEPDVVEEAERGDPAEVRRTELRARALAPAERFESGARRALADRDLEQARAALRLYRDSVDVGALGPIRADTLEALADSLTALLGALPR